MDAASGTTSAAEAEQEGAVGEATDDVSATTHVTPPFEIDVDDPRFYDDPWEAYRWLRTNAPIWWDEKNGFWVVSTHQDVSHVSRHQELYTTTNGVLKKPVQMSIITLDDPEHTDQRRLVSRGLTPRMVRKLTDHMRELANQIIDDIADKGECDFVEDMAIHVPLIVLAELMGLDPDQRDQLYRWSDDMMAGNDADTEDPNDPVGQKATQAGAEFVAMVTELIEDRRRDGSTDDIIGILTHAYDEGQLDAAGDPAAPADVKPMAHDELFMFLILLMVAGNETTRNAISGGLIALSRFPEERDRLIADPELMDPAVDELIRYVTPVLGFIRTVTTDHTYRGVDFKAGDRIYMLYQSANRDETVFDDPDVLKVDRSPNPHLAFGIGTHYCLGANLARNEVKVVFEELFKRLSDIRAVDPSQVNRGDSSLVLSIERLPAVFTPEPARAG